MAMVDAHGMFYRHSCIHLFMQLLYMYVYNNYVCADGMWGYYINTSAWVLRCSFLIEWANARASSVGTGDRVGLPRSFYI